MNPKKRYKKIGFISAILGLAVFCFFLIFSAKKSPCNVLLITVDALRADHLSYYGYKRLTSPNIDRLAEEGTIFLNSFSVSGSTIYTMPALFTGAYLGLSINEVQQTVHSYENVLDKKFTTLAEYLQSLGYETAAFLSHGHLGVGTGFEQGFNIYKNFLGKDNVITDKVIDFLNNYRSNKPFFLWIHYIGVHSPYVFPEGYINDFEEDRLYEENDKILKLNLENGNNSYESHGYLPRIVFRKGHYSLNYYIACYDAAIRHVDFQIGRVLERIKSNTLIIVTADHGESLGEHNVYFHHEGLSDAILHIPLIIKDDRYFKRRGRIPVVASSIDIVPTILKIVNPVVYFLNKHKFNGVDLTGILKNRGIKRIYLYFYYSQIHGVRDVHKNIKYFLHKNGKEELYFIPDEDDNLIDDVSGEIPSLLKTLRNNLKAWLNSYPIQSDKNIVGVPLDKKTEENLRSLGYLN
ncbi:MAG: sulfatase [Candidatus Omnitrophota bacterium]